LEATLIKLRLPSPNGATGTVRIVQISDLHGAVFGSENQQLVDLIASKSPDLIVATGDMVDVRAKDIGDCVSLFERLRRIATVVYSLGNHEAERPDLDQLIRALQMMGVYVVNNSAVQLSVNGITLRVGGLYYAEHLRAMNRGESIDVLLCHFPDKIALYSEYGVPLVFSGHTHGGQFRVPIAHIALYAPGQGLFPKYTAGLYEEDGSYMIVSRGLGNTRFPFRVHNPPEIVVADVTYEGKGL
jgi:predicted MPP superfamily phosphohydrolase